MYQRGKEAEEESEETKALKKDPTLPVSHKLFSFLCTRAIPFDIFHVAPVKSINGVS